MLMSPPPPFSCDSATDLATFRQAGFAFLGRVLDDGQIQRLREAEARLRAIPMSHDAANPLTVFRHQVAPHEPAVREVGLHGGHLPAMRSLIGPDLVWWYTQFVTKLPDGGSGKATFPWHQDNGYASVEPCTNITVWVALDDVDTDNGCVYVMPGSHLGGVLPHRRQNAESWHLSVAVDGLGVPAVMRAGEAVAFHGCTLHRSLANHTGKARRAFFMQYADAHAVHQGDLKPLVERPHAWVVDGGATYPTAT
jgi:phytanoyl-CoA hydroxylase